MARVARMGDPGSHGGAIISGSGSGSADGRAIARIGDIYACPIHGPVPIVTGSSGYSLDGRAVARVGDFTACGAVVSDGSGKHSDEG